MAGEQLGMDVAAGEELSRTFKNEAQKIGETINTINAKVNGIWWKGKDFDTFKSEWEAHRANLNKFKQLLEDNGSLVKRQVDSQRSTSSN